MKIRHGSWYETHGGHACFVRKTRGMGKYPIQGFVVLGTGSTTPCTWMATGEFDWGYFFSDLNIKGRWPYAKPKWNEIEQRYSFPKEAVNPTLILHSGVL